MTGPILGEVVTGVIDGFNKLFTTTHQFFPGTTQVFINGLTVVATNADGWAELPPSTIRLTEAPEVGDVVQVYYLAY